MKNLAHLVIYQDIGVLANVKETLCNISRAKGKRITRRFNVSCGDVPRWTFNSEAGVHAEVDNHRGRAYAARKRQMYRDKPNKFKGGHHDQA